MYDTLVMKILTELDFYKLNKNYEVLSRILIEI